MPGAFSALAIQSRGAVGVAEFFSIKRKYAASGCFRFRGLHTALFLVCAVSKCALLNSFILTARLPALPADLGAVLHRV